MQRRRPVAQGTMELEYDFREIEEMYDEEVYDEDFLDYNSYA